MIINEASDCQHERVESGGTGLVESAGSSSIYFNKLPECVIVELHPCC